MIEALIPKSEFIGLEENAHLCAGGESPMLKSHLQAIEQFMIDKSRGELARDLEAEKVEQARGKCANLFSVNAEDITFLSNASEGINNVAYGLDWKAGDNVVIADVEFPSGLLPWTRLERQGVEIRVVKHKNWQTRLDDIAALVDTRTRVVTLSHVSMLTGQRIDLPALSQLVRSSNALLLLDATHAAGVVPVDARLADVMVSSCYKWLLGTHGAAVFYVNRETLPDFEPPFLGWNSVASHGGWEQPTQFTLKPDLHRFQPGNTGFISVYILDNALDHLLDIGIENIEAHALALSGKIRDAVDNLGLELMTPPAAADRAGNVCFLANDLETVRAELERRQVLIWGAYAGFGRLRISTHLYNDSDDANRCIDALQQTFKN
ncbi:MAG: aminotransferase class V-fold PLP-dependent enzyme [Gammaproteobacteria bacterium]|nr:aminotransferase class V-fold PLP-dependent enzyme [Gammaproteobacteria bacterium]